MILNKRDLKFLSWLGLFIIQVFFSFMYIQDILLKIIILCIYMLFTSILWIRNVEKRSLLLRLGLNLRNVSLLIYAISLSIVVLYLKNSFGFASLLLGGSILLPIFEELFFRCYLLGSMTHNLPNFYSLSKDNRRSFIRNVTPPLLLTSLAFALVHNDIISFVIKGNIDVSLFVLITIRVVFSWAVGGVYILQKNITMPSIFHIIFNISYYIFNPQ